MNAKELFDYYNASQAHKHLSCSIGVAESFLNMYPRLENTSLEDADIYISIIFYIKYFLDSMFIDTTKLECMFTSTQRLCFCRSIFTVLQEIDKYSEWFNNQSDDVKYAYILRHLLNNDIYLVFDDKNVLQLSSKEECRKYLEPYILKFDTELKNWKETNLCIRNK